MHFIFYPKCTTCARAKKWLDDNNISYMERNINENNPSCDELKFIYEKSGFTIKKLFNTSGLLYKSLNLKNKLQKMSVESQFKLLATNGMLVKRPIIISSDFVLVGFKEAEYIEKIL